LNNNNKKHIFIQMGPYLSSPNTAKETEVGSDARLQFSAVSMQGWRNQ
jgi:hypothetical protein